MRGKRFVSLLLALCLLCPMAACEDGQERLYDQLTQKNSASPQPLPGSGGEKGLAGTLVVKAFAPTAQKPEIYWLAQEFMDLHPSVQIVFDYERDYGYGLDLTRQEVRAEQEAYYTRLRAELASGEADYRFMARPAGWIIMPYPAAASCRTWLGGWKATRSLTGRGCLQRCWTRSK